jgi:tight adherence protein C
MSVQNLLFLIGVFVLVSVIAFAWLQFWLPHALHERLALLRSAGAVGQRRRGWKTIASVWLERAARWLAARRLGGQGAAASPEDEDAAAPPAAHTTRRTDTRNEGLARQLVHAGWRQRHALVLFQWGRAALTLLLPALLMFALWASARLPSEGQRLLWAATAALLGYLLPGVGLRYSVQRRQQALFRAFPDALDLMRVCVQAGLGLDAAIERVAREVRLASVPLSEELGLTILELRAGVSRAEALRHLAERVGLPEVDALVTLLIQSDRLGTSTADALQVHSQTLRTQRRLRAEEAAAKLPVKLLFPLIFCVFPSLLTVLLGPAVIRLMAHLSKAAAAH